MKSVLRMLDKPMIRGENWVRGCNSLDFDGNSRPYQRLLSRFLQ
jgi:hypothetical protein